MGLSQIYCEQYLQGILLPTFLISFRRPSPLRQTFRRCNQFVGNPKKEGRIFPPFSGFALGLFHREA
jgi:hypothetical protein